MEKIKMDAYKALDMFSEFLKMSKLAEEARMSGSSLLEKRKKRFGKKLHDENVLALNNAIESIGKFLEESTIEYVPDRELLVQRIKVTSKYINMAYIYTRLGKTRRWYQTRVVNSEKGIFSEEEIISINLIIVDLASKLTGIELVLTEN